ncbi:hypothetical protein Tco_0731312 [Tanacetum coccineum]
MPRPKAWLCLSQSKRLQQWQHPTVACLRATVIPPKSGRTGNKLNYGDVPEHGGSCDVGPIRGVNGAGASSETGSCRKGFRSQPKKDRTLMRLEELRSASICPNRVSVNEIIESQEVFGMEEMMTNTQTPPHATTVVIPTGAPATNTVANHAERPEKFNGQNFKRWQQKMFFYLTTLNLVRFLKETAPQVEPPKEVAAIIERLPPSWVEFKNYLKHMRKEVSVEDLVAHIHIEEDNKLAQKNTYTPYSA